MAVSRARKIAFEILRRVESEGAYASDLLHERLGDPDEHVKHEDAALATELTLGVLRWQRLLDFLIERQSGKRVAEFDLEVLIALRLGLYQLRFLTRVPARAAVNESVELAKWARKRSAAPLVNAVLRRAPAEATEKLLPGDLSPIERLAILYSHPTWMVARWLERMGEERTRELLEANNRAAPLTLAVHEGQAGMPVLRDQVIRELQRAGLRVEPGRWLRSAFYATGGSPTRTAAFRRGWVSLQDEASQMIPLLLDVCEGQAVLDVCAAPGSKTIALAGAAGAKGCVVAADLYPHRLRAVRQQFRRVGVRGAHLVALDATQPLPFSTPFDRILVDAPCSGTGTLARNPEIRWRLQPEDLADLQGRQVAMLGNALDALGPGGRLLYSTCSLEPEENEQVVARVLSGRHDVRHVPALPALANHLAAGRDASCFFDNRGFFRTFPPEHATDGFFAAAFEKC